MPQTVLALLAMMTATLFAVNQQRNVLKMRYNQIENEVGMATTSVAMDRLESIGAHAFDEHVVSADSSDLSSPNELTLESEFTADSPSNDIDDYDGSEKDLYFVLDADTLWFRAFSTVSYADEDDPEQEVDMRTKLKKATVRVYSLTIPYPDTIRLSRTYSCGTACNWN